MCDSLSILGSKFALMSFALAADKRDSTKVSAMRFSFLQTSDIEFSLL